MGHPNSSKLQQRAGHPATLLAGTDAIAVNNATWAIFGPTAQNSYGSTFVITVKLTDKVTGAVTTGAYAYYGSPDSGPKEP